MNSVNERTILELMKKRESVIESDEKTNPDQPWKISPELNEITKQIKLLLSLGKDSLSVEFMLETIAGLGCAPSLLYDDNGHWTVGGDGLQNLISNDERDKETVFEASWIVGPNRWRRTIRQALYDYVDGLVE